MSAVTALAAEVRGCRGMISWPRRSARPAASGPARGSEGGRCGPGLVRGFADQAALYGVLAQLEALGLELIEVRRVPPG